MRNALLIAALVALAPLSAAGASGVGPEPCPPTSGICTEGGPKYIYISPTGNDTTGNGTLGNPWQTPGKANTYITSKRLGRGNRVTVFGATGTYPALTSTITIGPNGGGVAGGSVTYKCNGTAGACVVQGGTPVTGWSVDVGSVQKATVPVCPYTLWENGVRARVAREPDRVYTVHHPTAFAPYFRMIGVNNDYDSYQYNNVDITPDAWSLTDLRLFVFSGGNWNWFTDTATVTAHNSGTDTFTVGHSGTKFAAFQNATGSRYTVQGLRDHLDEAGEFSCDTGTLTLYYWPNNTPIGNQTITRPTVSRIFSLVGTSQSARTQRVTLDGWTLEYSDFADWYRSGWCGQDTSTCGEHDPSADPDCPGYEYQTTQPFAQQGLVVLDNTNDVTIKNMHLRHAGFNGVFTVGYGQRNTIKDNWIEHVGHSGIFLQGPYPTVGDIHKSNTVTDNWVVWEGELVGNGQGMGFNQTSGNLISHNQIENGPRDCMHLAGYVLNCGDPDGVGGNPAKFVTAADIYTHDNTVSYNKLVGCAQDSGDIGMLRVSFTGGEIGVDPYPTNYFVQNVIHGGYAHPSMLDQPVNGLFTDNGTRGQTLSHILISNTQGAAERENDSGSHITTNVSWLGGFDLSLIDFANIGVRNTNPYISQAKVTYLDNFESTFPAAGGWSIQFGAPALSTTQAHSATHSVTTTADQDLAYRVFDRRAQGIVTMWLYDASGDTTAEALGNVAETSYSAGTFSTWNTTAYRQLGVYTPCSTTFYCWFSSVGGSGVTSVARTTAWHELKWDYTAGDGVRMYIDSNLVRTEAGTVSQARWHNMISFGDADADGRSGTFYWDDIQVQ